MNSEIFLPEFFSSSEFVSEHSEFVERYANLRVKGFPAITCLRRVFGAEMAENLGLSRINHLESTFLFQELYEKAVRNTPVDELWSGRLAIVGKRAIFHT